MNLEDSLARLFAPRPDGTVEIFVAYVGLRHLAEQTGHRQAVERAVDSEEKECQALTGQWIGEGPTPREVGEKLLEARPGRVWRLLVVAIKYLDNVLVNQDDSLKNHLRRVVLPEELAAPEYRLLRQPDSPIADWIKEAKLPALPRGQDQTGYDLHRKLQLQWQIFPIGRFSPLEAEFVSGLPHNVAKALQTRVDAKDFTIGLATPLAGLDYDFVSYEKEESESGLRPYRFSGLSAASPEADARAAAAQIRKVLAVCRRERVAVLLYPELTLDATLIAVLRKELSEAEESEYPVMVVAGSFHEQIENDPGEFVNRSRAFDYDGEEIVELRHDKLKAFQLTPGDLERLDEDRREELRRKMHLPEGGGGIERIRGGSRLRIVDTPMGRMVTAICLDFCGVMEALAKASGVNVAWVPTMSPTLRRFREHAKRLGESAGTASFVVNSEWLLKALGVEADSREAPRLLCYLPFRKGLFEDLEPVERDSGLRLFRICEKIFLSPEDRSSSIH